MSLVIHRNLINAIIQSELLLKINSTNELQMVRFTFALSGIFKPLCCSLSASNSPFLIRDTKTGDHLLHTCINHEDFMQEM